MEPEIPKSKPRSVVTPVDVVIPIRSVVIFLVATLCTAVILELTSNSHVLWGNTSLGHILNNNATSSTDEVPKYAIYQQGSDEAHLRHVIKLLELFGYERTSIDDDWRLLWAHDYPYFKMPQRMKQLKPEQIVNHMPGTGFITNKVDLSTTALPFLPRAFRLPAERDAFLQYANAHPGALFVQKHNEHRHITIRAPNELNLSASDNFVQEFVQNPFLVDGYKFDIGVYTVVTSIDPLLAYIYTGDVLFRYCAVKYHPFDAGNVDKYIVGDDYLPTWEVPSLRKYYNRFGGSMRAAFDAYVRDQSLDPTDIWPQVEDIIRKTILSKQQDIASVARSYRNGNFFELLRFDLIIDANLRVHLMEANMSPNLSSAHYKPNALLYEQVLYSVLNLVNIGAPFKYSVLKQRTEETESIITAEKNLATNLNACAIHSCEKSCDREECALCLPCLSGSEYDILEKAHREHLHRIDMKRIFPKPILHPENFDIDIEVQNMTKKNAWLNRWFIGKCQDERNWCT